jgi:hypothetical protein
MKEQEYIDLSDLVRLQTVSHALREITPANSTIIGSSEFGVVADIVSTWIDMIREKITIED